MSRTTSLGEAPVRLLCQTFDVSRQAFYAAGKATPAATVERAERPGPWATHAELVAAIRSTVADQPAWGVRKVWASLRRHGVVASRKRVWVTMAQLGLTLPPVRERQEEACRGHVAVADSNRRWATDLTTVWTRQDGVVAVAPVIDCGDRTVLACEASKSQESTYALAGLSRTLSSEFGEPLATPDGLELRTDHGSQYTGRDCAELCTRWGLDHTFAPVGRPTGNAVAERFILTLKIELLWTRDWESAEQISMALRTYVPHYNNERPHQALGWQTPAERRRANLGLDLAIAA